MWIPQGKRVRDDYAELQKHVKTMGNECKILFLNAN